MGSRYSVDLGVTVNVSDGEEEREHALPLLQTGLCGFDRDKPYQTMPDCSPQKYVADGEIQIVPHDRCPKCWGIWDLKFDNRSCGECGATLGEGVKVLLDADLCPDCERGKVSMRHPRCSECGYKADPKLVTWG